MTSWLAKDYINKALARWDTDGKYWAKKAIEEIEGVEKERADYVAENEKLREFLNQLDISEIRDEAVLILKPVGEIYKDIRPKPSFGDSVILLTCAKHSTPELFLKMIQTILPKKP